MQGSAKPNAIINEKMDLYKELCSLNPYCLSVKTQEVIQNFIEGEAKVDDNIQLVSENKMQIEGAKQG